MSLGIRGHDACWHECDKVLSAFEESDTETTSSDSDEVNNQPD